MAKMAKVPKDAMVCAAGLLALLKDWRQSALEDKRSVPRYSEGWHACSGQIVAIDDVIRAISDPVERANLNRSVFGK